LGGAGGRRGARALMVFTSLHFVAFFAVVYALYRALPHRGQNALLLVASYYFYAAWDWRFLSLLLGSTVVDYYVGRYLGRPERAPGRRRAALVLSLVFNFGMLGFFKYFNFLEASLAAMAASVGWTVDVVTLEIVLPIGISFYTFMTVSYVIDVYRGDVAPSDRLAEFALFVAYFPHLVAGPILRASLLLPQISTPRRITRAQSIEGLWLVLWGAFQKMFVADNLARVVDTVYGPSATPTGFEVLLSTYAFAFQIYGDFAGYSNIARGTSKLLGIELNVNFLFPYFVTSPRAFWREWHISLSTWLRDYLYVPLGGSRGSAPATYRNLLITMAIGGLWHGAAWTFVIWGLYQGGVLVAARLIQQAFGPARATAASGFTAGRIALGVIMFHVTAAGWLIFRAESVSQLVAFARLVVTGFAPSMSAVWSLALPILQYAGPLLVVHVAQARARSELAPLAWPFAARVALAGAVGYLLLLFGDFEGAQFIYFQF
jgi:D-alanyl-lipoteichoic acid acyltransferase DltB (MBOAT superfamily)